MPMAVVAAPHWLGQELGGGLSCCPGGLWGQTHTTAPYPRQPDPVLTGARGWAAPGRRPQLVSPVPPLALRSPAPSLTPQ